MIEMTIKEAIKILFQLQETQAIHCRPEDVEALKLGCAALERIQKYAKTCSL